MNKETQLIEQQETADISNNCNYGPQKPWLIKNECLHQIFEQAADEHQQNIAISFKEQEISYAELEARANSLAHYLRSLGVTTGSSVGICLPKSIELYIGILAIMKAGAAYIPLDPDYPQDRVLYILENSQIKILIANSEISKKFNHAGITVKMDEDGEKISKFSNARLLPSETGVSTEDLAYIIYTSGSTGKPKGVMIQHKGICHLVRASQEIYGITQADKVFQGISVAFDFSLEEIWMAFANGATLFPATPEMTTAGPALSQHLSRLGITAISCVPTLLTMMDEDVPTLNFINVGGEDCPQSLVSKWSKPSRRFFNTYGPTETSVNATYAECLPDKKITIGKPLPNFSAYVLDENMQQIPFGEAGELYIGGIGLAKGYVNRDDLTAERFVSNPFKSEKDHSSKLYKSGDLVKFDENGDIVFMGRIDTQVKIRGFRIELSEIEALISNIANVKTAIASVYEKTPGLKSIVAYILPKDSSIKINPTDVRNILKEGLPAYMLPQYIEIISEVPQTPNGKIDRKNLPTPTNQIVGSSEIIAPTNEIEKIIANVWQEIFEKNEISITDHFFYDLGGHSLFAAKVVSALRQKKDFQNLSVSDVYQNPTISELAAFVEEIASTENEMETITKKTNVISKFAFSLLTIAQAAGVYLLYSIIGLPFIAFYLLSKHNKHTIITMSQHSLWTYIFLVVFAYFPTVLILSIIAKWLLIGEYKPGEYPLWGQYYFRFWLVRRIQGLVPLQYLAGTPFMGAYLRLMGAKIGKNVYIGTHNFQAHDMIEIKDNASIGADSHLLGFTVEDGFLKIASVTVGKNCYVGNHSVLCPRSVMLDNSHLDSQSMLAANTIVPAGESWLGSPAQRDEHADGDIILLKQQLANKSSEQTKITLDILYVLAILFLPFISTIPYLPIGVILLMLFFKIGYWALFASIILAPVYILLLSFEIALLKKIALPETKAGIYKTNSIFFVRKWFVDQLMNLSLSSMNTLFATLYTPPFLRMLGAKIGKRVEISTVTHISPDLLDVKDESFVADAACLGASKIHMGHVLLAKTVIGERTFIGNAALVPSNIKLGKNCLVGVLSTPPKDTEGKDDTSWLGLPPIFLPKRDINTDFSETETYKPSRALYAKRYTIEFFRVTMPAMINTVTTFALFFVFISLYRKISHSQMLLAIPVMILAAQLIGALVVIGLKWLIVGEYIPRVRPLWSTFVWRSEFITGIYEDVISAPMLGNLLGTPFACFILRRLGVTIGEQVYLDTTYVTEFDLVKIGSGANINFHCSLQTHLFEDRVMKMSYVDISENCSVGSRAVVLYDTKMNPHSSINSLSLLMKGESLAANTYWEGVPAKHISAAKKAADELAFENEKTEQVQQVSDFVPASVTIAQDQEQEK